ncbi:MAG: glycosyltransferase family 2 protein [Chloroflexi bacterium]|nr:glycosyltransferase family 2 protein [Chloroflexota bacterium]
MSGVNWGQAVVVVNWERSEDTIECVRSLVPREVFEDQIIVVDNGSQDDSVREIQAACPRLTILGLRRNLGFAGGFNAGIEKALALGAERVLVLNNDVIVEPGSVMALRSAEWDISVPKILFHSAPHRIWAAGARWRRFPPSVVMLGYGVWGRGTLDGPQWNKPYPLEYATGCALMVRRHVFERVGLFDEQFVSYWEDYDFCFRARAAELTIGYVPDARILHKVSKSFGQYSSKWWWYMGRNTVLFYRKDNRFPVWMLGTFLIWATARETAKGNAAHLADFWRGAREGARLIRQKEQVCRGTRGL